MRHASLFSGIGGFDLAAEWIGWENVFQAEWDKRCQRVLRKKFSGVEIYGNIDEFDGTKYAGRINVISGGPPCQPSSNAGKRKGEKDDRWKWPEAIRVFGEIGPDVGVFENPDDLLSLDDGRAFERICLSLEDLGYKVETFGLPAACVGAWHERDRIWIIAYNNRCYDSRRLANREGPGKTRPGKSGNQSERETSFRQRLRFEPLASPPFVPNPNSQGLPFAARTELGSIPKTNGAFPGSATNGAFTTIGSYWQTEPGVGRMVHGLSDRVDRIKSLGNAIVPQVAYEIFKAIEAVNL